MRFERPSDYTLDDVRRILAIYHAQVGGRRSARLAEDVWHALAQAPDDTRMLEFRIGSIYSHESKLWFERRSGDPRLLPAFDPNLARESDAVSRAVAEFHRAVLGYLDRVGERAGSS